MSENVNSKKTKYTLAKIIVALCVVLCIVLTVFEMGATYRFVKAAEVDGTQYSVAEYNWMYTNSLYEIYSDYYATYGDLAAYILNPQAHLSEQNYSEEMTWAEYIRNYTNESLVEMTKLYDLGKEAGYVLPEESYELIDAEWESLGETAAEYGYTIGTLAEINYGRGVNEKVFKGMYERYLYALSFASETANAAEFTEEEIDAYYEEHKEDLDTVSYAWYYADGAAEEGEDADAAMDEAKAEAEAVLEGTKVGEFNTVTNGRKAYAETVYADWLFDEARVAGDKEMFESASGYYVVEFMQFDDIHYNTVSVRHILVPPTDASSEESLEAAKALAEAYHEEWVSMGSTEETFAELAMKYSSDSSATVGGLYENVYKGQMVEEFENWCFDSARKPGDSEIIETGYGYHIMYFVGEAEEYYDYAVGTYLLNETYTEFIDSAVEGVEFEELSGMKQTGKHLD